MPIACLEENMFKTFEPILCTGSRCGACERFFGCPIGFIADSSRYGRGGERGKYERKREWSEAVEQKKIISLTAPLLEVQGTVSYIIYNFCCFVCGLA